MEKEKKIKIQPYVKPETADDLVAMGNGTGSVGQVIDMLVLHAAHTGFTPFGVKVDRKDGE